jgi:hypothetical protein
MRLSSALFGLALWSPCFAQAPRPPDVEAQRAAMKKLDFTVGKWSGEARLRQGPGEPLELIFTEDAQYKLDGLVLLVEGTGQRQSDGKAVVHALATVSYDEEKQAYHMRAYNDGRYMETDLKLIDGGEGFTWGFTFGRIKASYQMRINEKGEWTESAEAAIGDQAPRKFWELTVRRRK